MPNKSYVFLFLLHISTCLCLKPSEEAPLVQRHRVRWQESQTPDIVRPQDKTIIVDKNMVNVATLGSLANAVFRNDHKRVAVLLQRGHDPYRKEIAGVPLKQYAKENGHTEIIRILDQFDSLQN